MKCILGNKFILAAGLFLGLGPSLFAQTCHDKVLSEAPDSRYQASGGVVADLKTGLTWQRCSVGQSWDGSDCTGEAISYSWSEGLSLSDGKWRLPNITELASLVETACFSPAINMSIFPSTPSDEYWSSSTYYQYGTYAWYVRFSDGRDGANILKTDKNLVRLVSDSYTAGRSE